MATQAGSAGSGEGGGGLEQAAADMLRELQGGAEGGTGDAGAVDSQAAPQPGEEPGKILDDDEPGATADAGAGGEKEGSSGSEATGDAAADPPSPSASGASPAPEAFELPEHLREFDVVDAAPAASAKLGDATVEDLAKLVARHLTTPPAPVAALPSAKQAEYEPLFPDLESISEESRPFAAAAERQNRQLWEINGRLAKQEAAQAAAAADARFQSWSGAVAKAVEESPLRKAMAPAQRALYDTAVQNAVGRARWEAEQRGAADITPAEALAAKRSVDFLVGGTAASALKATKRVIPPRAAAPPPVSGTAAQGRAGAQTAERGARKMPSEAERDAAMLRIVRESFGGQTH